MPKKPQTVPFETVLTALLDENQPFPPVYLHRFSDIAPKELDELVKIWPQVNPTRRQGLLEDLEELAEVDTMVSFDDLAQFALKDPDPQVRTTAVRLLWEDQDVKLVPVFLDMLENDSDTQVRSAAASALGLFVYLGELEEIQPDVLHTIEDRLLHAIKTADHPIIRRHALEAMGYSSRDEVPDLIQDAYDMRDTEWVSSALFAMGRSADSRWETPVINMLSHPDARIQVEAVRAAGNLELAAARLPLLDMLETAEDLDEDVMAALIWSLSQIGGEGVREALESLADETEDEDEADYIDQALENLSFTEDFGLFEMFDFDAGDDEENMKEINLLEESESDDEDDEPLNGDGKGKH